MEPLAVVMAVIVLSSCGGGESTENPAMPETTAENPDSSTEPVTAEDDQMPREGLAENGPMPEGSACGLISSENWQAWVDMMPGRDAQPTLHVTGEAMFSTPGYEVSWREGPADRSAMPIVHLILDITPPEGIVSQVIVTRELSYTGPALTPTLRGVIVRCGDKVIAEITEVPQTQ